MISPGGVCAVLDYDLDLMIDYVAEMAQRLLPTANLTFPSLRKFVSGLLSSTRLPSTTILLGMHYLAKRANMRSAAGSLVNTERDVWRMLTVGLLLGSKFLDDNTFQNRSWSEVSGLLVTELNSLEAEWLLLMNYCLYVNLDKNPDYQAWIANWELWRKNRSNQLKAPLDQIVTTTPLEENPNQSSSYTQLYGSHAKPIMTMEPPPGFKHSYNKNIWGQSYATPPYLTPPSAPDSDLTTPVYMNMNINSFGLTARYNDWVNYEPYSNRTYTHIYPSQSQQTYHRPTQIAANHTPVYNGPKYHYGQGTWNHSPECGQYSCYICCEPRDMTLKNQSLTSLSLRNQILA